MPESKVDPQYDKILLEIEEGRRGVRGPKVKLTYDKYKQLIGLCENLIKPRQIALQIEIDDQTLVDYMKLSPTLNRVVEVAYFYSVNLAKFQMLKILRGTPYRKYKTLDRKGDLVEVEQMEELPPYKFVQWFLEKTDIDFKPTITIDSTDIDPVMKSIVEAYARHKQLNSANK